MAEVRFENVTKIVGGKKFADNVSFDIRDREFVSILGEPGSGKSMVLRMIAGLERPDSGNIYIGDRNVNDLRPAERNVAMVFQSFALYPHKTVYENLTFPLFKRAMSKEEIDKRVRSIAEMLRISHVLEKRPALLSGGERQRVAIGRAIVRNSDALLMDEPLSNLDAKLRLHMRAELRKIQKEIGQTAIFTTADEVEALSIADRICVYREGSIVQFDAPEAIYDRPNSLYVAQMVGRPQMNFVDGTIRFKDGRSQFVSSNFTTDLSTSGPTPPADKEVVLGIRPSDTRVSTREVNGGFQCEVYVAEFVGSEAILDIKIGDQLLRARVPVSVKAEIGDKLWVKFDESRIHIFDKGTASAIQ
ncbi:MAG: ABC transporter ATP-binding protein [Thaumarchaeota archaeon]|nr:MAG: ABC transporter ATP-binding protein [Nitrososphaerota archaeon]TLY16481.1 MAG: ABC transporter ATP-binding protein [Nitrososphaerota archaeon]